MREAVCCGRQKWALVQLLVDFRHTIFGLLHHLANRTATSSTISHQHIIESISNHVAPASATSIIASISNHVARAHQVSSSIISSTLNWCQPSYFLVCENGGCSAVSTPVSVSKD